MGGGSFNGSAGEVWLSFVVYCCLWSWVRSVCACFMFTLVVWSWFLLYGVIIICPIDPTGLPLLHPLKSFAKKICFYITALMPERVCVFHPCLSSPRQWAHVVHLHVVLIAVCVWILVLECVCLRGRRSVSRVPRQNNESKWIPDGLLFLFFCVRSMTWGEWQPSNRKQTHTLRLWTSPTA